MINAASLIALCAVLSASAPAALAQGQAPEHGDKVGLEKRPGLGGQQAEIEVPPLGHKQRAVDQPAARPTVRHEWVRPGVPEESQVLFRAKELIGRQVQTTEGEDLGALEEIVFHPDVGIFAVVKLENNRLAPLPWAMVQRLSQQNLVVSGTSRTMLTGAPTITDQQWDLFNDPEFTQKLYTHHGLKSDEAMGAPGERQTGPGPGVGAPRQPNQQGSRLPGQNRPTP
jgi:sporulation protein YlmC with PRC-barrel domain